MKMTTTSEPPHELFSKSIAISGLRCLLTYLVFPFLTPALGLVTGYESWIGLGLGLIAIVANIASIRRFKDSDHNWKWPMISLNTIVIMMMLYLTFRDLGELI